AFLLTAVFSTVAAVLLGQTVGTATLRLSPERPQVFLQSQAAEPSLPQGRPVPEAVNQPVETLPSRFSFSPQWLAAFGVFIGAIAFAIASDRDYSGQKRQRRQLARQLVTEFTQQQSVQNILDILDFEEYRKFGFRHPETGKAIFFLAHDERLKRALRSHGQMVKTRQGLTALTQNSPSAEAIAPDPPAPVISIDTSNRSIERAIERYEAEEFAIEITLRNWFDDFLGGLEHLEEAIEGKLITLTDVKPYIRYWIDVIGDRKQRRQGGSSFYDQLYHYIYWAGYHGVQHLFERFGYKILPPPYDSHDFIHFGEHIGKYDAQRALCLAKAAYLVYEDETYVESVMTNWLRGKSFDRWMKMSPITYVKTLVEEWLQEGVDPGEPILNRDFHYINNTESDTQGFLFRQRNRIFLVFRGSQQRRDWRTNFGLRLMRFRLQSTQIPEPPAGEVHRGFQSAWESVEREVMEQLTLWRKQARSQSIDPELWITGHSLGGALAALSAASLQSQGFQVSGLYTFGQPRVGDWTFVNAMNELLGDRSYRFVNNNDVVPLIPLQVSLINPTRRYGHFGAFRYFDSSGKLYLNSTMFSFWLDRLWGFIKGIRQSGFEALSDHGMEFYVANLRKARELEVVEEKLNIERQVVRHAADTVGR
ncbi:MAG: lipase family protein, partial [Cyanobacteria bacterium P01_D01_bin.128]